jgi:glycosyltransferase involved in cell wall biosynthesis
VQTFHVVHVHHTAGFQVVPLCRALRGHPRVVVSMHDHSSLCPRYYLLTPQGDRCGLFQCQSACGYSAEYVTEYREAFGEILRNAAAIIHFSGFSKEAAEIVYGALTQAQHIPHVLSESAQGAPITLEPLPSKSAGGELRVAFVGTLAPHKGLSLAQALAEGGLEGSSVTLRCAIFGDVHGVPEQGRLTIPVKGTYRSIAELRAWLEEFKPHVALFPGKCPETFGLTAEEVSALGIPVMVGPEGGPAERVKQRGTGWVLGEVSLEECRRVLTHILEAPREWEECVKSTHALRETSPAKWAACYRSLYGQMGSQAAPSATEVLRLVSDPGISAKESWRRIIRRVTSAVVHKGIIILDGLRVRRLVEHCVRAILPTRSIERLRALRH